MRIPRVRFTVRRLMIAVAVVAAIVAFFKRRDDFERVAEYHRSRIGMADIDFSRRYEIRFFSPKNRWHYDMMHKYIYAARDPWLPVAPDPPEPE
jgi:hypothetical protein